MTERNFREALLAAETVAPDKKKSYDERIKAMYERQLSGWWKVAWIASGLLGLCHFLGFAAAAWWSPAPFPVVARAGFVAGSLFGLCWAAFSYNVVRKGTINLKRDNNIYTGLIWALVVVMMTVFLMLGMSMDDPSFGARIILFGLVFLIMGLAFLIRNIIEQSELKLRENFLRLELQVAELNEKLSGKS